MNIDQYLILMVLSIGLIYVMFILLKAVFTQLSYSIAICTEPIIDLLLYLTNKRLCRNIADCDIRLQQLFDICKKKDIHVKLGLGVSRVQRHSLSSRLDTISLNIEVFNKRKDKNHMVMVFAHELAHILWDRENNHILSVAKDSTIKDKYEWEVKAWKRAEKLMLDETISCELFDELKESSLKTYADAVYATVQSGAHEKIVPKLSSDSTIKLAQKLEELFYDPNL